MNKKKPVAFRLSEKTLSDINRYQEENNFPTRTKALEKIVDKVVNQTSDIDEISKQIIKEIDEKYNALFTRIRLGTTTADINSQIIIEILNSMLIATNQESKAYLTSTVEAEAVTAAKAEVRNKIAYYKQLKDNKSK